MFTFLTSTHKVNVSIILLIVSLLIVMPISSVNSARPSEDTIEIKLPHIIDLSGGGMAYKNQILAFGTQCEQVINLPQLDEEDLSWIAPKMKSHRYQLTRNSSVEQMVQQINNQDYDCTASPNYLIYGTSASSSWGSPHTGYGANANPSDIRSQLTGMNALHQMTTSPLQLMNDYQGSGVSVAMFDTFSQQRSQAHLQQNSFGSIDFQGDYTTHIPATFGLPVNLSGHGEAVISLLKSIAPQSNVSVYRVLDDDAFGSLEGLIDALNDFARGDIPNHTIINLSLGVKANEDDDVPILKNVLEELYKQHNVLIVAAAGNEKRDAPTQYPAAYEFVIGAAASDHEGNQATYANKGDVLAPGGDKDCGESNSNSDSNATYDNCLAILNSQSPTGASYWKGSSFSAGIISGVAALLWEENPELSTQGVREHIQ